MLFFYLLLLQESKNKKSNKMAFRSLFTKIMRQGGERYDESALQWFVANPTFIGMYGWKYCKKRRLFYDIDNKHFPVRYDDEIEYIKKK